MAYEQLHARGMDASDWEHGFSLGFRAHRRGESWALSLLTIVPGYWNSLWLRAAIEFHRDRLGGRSTRCLGGDFRAVGALRGLGTSQ